MKVIRCAVQNTDHNIFTHIITTVINIVYIKIYKTNTHFREILVALAGTTPEILHSHENKGFFLMV